MSGDGPRGLARGLTNYGDADFSLYLRRSFAKSMGYSKEMLARPVVGIAQSASGFNNCHRHFPELVDAVKRGVVAAGGLPIDFPTISLGEVLMKPTTMLFRNLMAMDVEESIRSYPLDGVVLLTGCDKTNVAALGNVVRGVPLNNDGYFFEPLWTNWRIGPNPGILDWFSVMAGVMALATLTMHGALYIAHKTCGAVNERARRIALATWPVVLALTFISLMLTIRVHLDVVDNYKRWPIGLAIPLIVFASLAGVLYFASEYREKAAFICSSTFVAGMLGGAAFGIYPDVLPAAMNRTNSLTIYNTAAARHGLSVGLVWWSIGIVIAIGYFVFVYRVFKGKVVLEAGEGH